MQAIKFLNSLIVEKSFRDDVWVELKWNPVVEQMWKGFKLNHHERKLLIQYMEDQRKGRISWAFQEDKIYEQNLCGELCGWDPHRYAISVDRVLDKIINIINGV